MFDDKIYLKKTVVDNEGSGTERDENVHNEGEENNQPSRGRLG